MMFYYRENIMYIILLLSTIMYIILLMTFILLLLKPSIVWHFYKICDFVQRYFIIVYPSRSFSQASFDPVLPHTGRQVNFPFRGSGTKYGRYDDFFAYGKFVFYDVTSCVRRVQHPQWPYQWYCCFQSFLYISFQQWIYLFTN